MNSVDSLIREIQDHEVVEIDGCLEENSLKKIQKRILNTIAEEKRDVPESSMGRCDSMGGSDGRGRSESLRRSDGMGSSDGMGRSDGMRRSHSRKRSRKSWLVLGLAAVLAFALGLSVYAAKENEWDIALIDFMGISNANTLQLENGVVEINQGQKSYCVDYGHTQTGEEKEVEMRAVSSIGDKNEVYIRIETDYMLPEDFNPETDYILPEDHSLTVSPMKNGYASVFTYFAEDNKLGFLLSISNCQDINKADISLSIENLYLYHDRQDPNTDVEEELLCRGNWDLNWSYHYKSSTETRHMLRSFQSKGVTYYLTKVEISPISIRLEAFRMPWDRDKEYPDGLLEEIHFSDGTILQVDGLSSSGMENGMFTEVYIGAEVLGDGIDPKEVELLVIEGERIVLR